MCIRDSHRPDRGVSVYAIARSARPDAGQLFVPLDEAERCATSLRFIGQPAARLPAAAPAGDERAPPACDERAPHAGADGRWPFDLGSTTFALHDETTDAIAAGLSTQPRAVHAYVLARCRGLGASRLPASFARAWEDALALDRAAALNAAVTSGVGNAPAVDAKASESASVRGVASGPCVAPELTAAAPGGACSAAADAGAPASGLAHDALTDEAHLARAHAHLRRELRHGQHVMMQESNPGSYYAHVEHHFS